MAGLAPTLIPTVKVKGKPRRKGAKGAKAAKKTKAGKECKSNSLDLEIHSDRPTM